MSSDLQPLGRLLLLAAAVLAIVGVLVLLGAKLPWFGRLPGDIAIRRDGFSCYFPFTSCLLVSLVISGILWLVGRWR